MIVADREPSRGVDCMQREGVPVALESGPASLTNLGDPALTDPNRAKWPHDGNDLHRYRHADRTTDWLVVHDVDTLDNRLVAAGSVEAIDAVVALWFGHIGRTAAERAWLAPAVGRA